MRSICITCLSFVIGIGGVGAAGGAGAAFAQDGKPVSLEERASYGIGLNLGRNLIAQAVDVDVDFVTRGIRDALAGGELLLSDEEIGTALQEFQAKIQERQQALMAEMAEKNKAAGDKFLAENGSKPEVVSLPSGLQYQVLKAGDGSNPSSTNKVRVHYEGRLIDGTVFDSSYQRGEAVEFQLGQVIAGWNEAVPLMKIGAKWRVWVPSDLAYGPQGRPPVIEPSSTLVFDIELLGIVPAAGE